MEVNIVDAACRLATQPRSVVVVDIAVGGVEDVEATTARANPSSPPTTRTIGRSRLFT